MKARNVPWQSQVLLAHPHKDHISQQKISCAYKTLFYNLICDFTFCDFYL